MEEHKPVLLDILKKMQMQAEKMNRKEKDPREVPSPQDQKMLKLRMMNQEVIFYARVCQICTEK